MRIALALALAGAVAVVATAAYGRGGTHGVPRGFRPETGAAVGTRDLWLLGFYKCGKSYCDALVRTTDAGEHFTRVGLPSFSSEGFVPTIRFVNARDGFAYVVRGTPLFATRDGGESWHREGPNRHVREFAAAGGYAYLLDGRHTLERLRIGSNVWGHGVRLEVVHPPASLAARGRKVWFLGPPRRRPDSDSVTLSSDRGRTFTSRRGPCFAELGGGLVPAADGVVWAVCPTGNMAELALSRNGGRTFPTVRPAHYPGGLQEPGLVNSAQLAAASARVAVLGRGAEGALLRTTDTGRHWRAVPHTAEIQSLDWLAFSTPRVGEALVETGHGTHLWRTADAGATWHSRPIR